MRDSSIICGSYFLRIISLMPQSFILLNVGAKIAVPPTTSRVTTPPNITAGIRPIYDAAKPDSKSPNLIR
jgi:hypothetical protein